MKTPPVQIQVGPFPNTIVGIGTAVFMGGEDYPTAETFLYHHTAVLAQGDTREQGFTKFHTAQLKTFFPGSGCGIIIEDGKIAWTESGLEELIGHEIELFQGKTSLFTFIVYYGSSEEVDEKTKFTLGIVAEALGILFAPPAEIVFALARR